MKIIIFIIILSIIIIILCNINKNINDNFINYQMTKIGKNTKDIKIHGRNINIETNNNTLNVDKLCIDDACLNMINEETLPREQGPQGVCTDNDCYYCTCNNGQPADIGTGPNSCKKKKSDSDTEQCKSCKLGYQLNSKKKCVLCTSTYNGRGGGVPSNTYNDNPFNTGSCKICQGCPGGHYRKDCGGTSGGRCEGCQGCPAGQRRINCGGENPGTCAQNTCSCSNGTVATGSACTTNGENICDSCNNSYYKSENKCKACQEDCPGGQYRKDCGGTSGGRCEGCQGCPAGQRRINCGGKNPGTCAQNTCSCSNGTAATGSACTTNGENICRSCGDGYRKIGNTCQQWTCNTPMSEWGNKSCSFIVTKVREALGVAAHMGVPHTHPLFLNEIYVRTGYDALDIQNIYSHCDRNIC